eukprot:TRINITY_DN102222_c0_g1_i1.p1 TRINITY_DN102222_c0_g1~~TRINITY_DN102222_c0_g1_i1.p1  ORF type:complete len:228 (+),score=68.83 TRINITY_DN102222_c0_g1_i1:101-784(+)
MTAAVRLATAAAASLAGYAAKGEELLQSEALLASFDASLQQFDASVEAEARVREFQWLTLADDIDAVLARLGQAEQKEDECLEPSLASLAKQRLHAKAPLESTRELPPKVWPSAGAGASPSKPRSNSVEALHKDSEVEVISTFESNNRKGETIKAGQTGVVQLVDEEGDALIKFERMARKQWVRRMNFHYLKLKSAPVRAAEPMKPFQHDEKEKPLPPEAASELVIP